MDASAMGAGTDPGQARSYFDAGVAAVSEQDFASALEAFQAAADGGLAGPAVHYNIGVCAWELGDLDRAEAAFLVVAQDPGMAALGAYNLGLVSLRRGDERRAAALFEQTLELSDDATLRQLARARLSELRPVEPARAARPRLTAFLAAYAGYDDNVALIGDAELLGVSDTGSALIETQLAAIAPLGHGFRLEGGAYWLQYDQLAEYDQSGLALDLLHRRAMGEWTGEAGLGVAYSRLDGERFEDQRSVVLRAARALAGGWDLRLGYRYDDIDGNQPFTGLSGDRHDASLRLQRYLPGQRLRLEYRLEMNDRESKELSPDRHRVEAEWITAMPAGLQGSIGLAWRDSRYSLDDANWSERRLGASVGLLGQITRHWAWVLRYDWLDNDGSVDEFEYSRQRVVAGIEGLF
jgi:tetratricopeptide (TPR) repeat protein